MSGFVYVALLADGTAKVGFSAVSPVARLDTINADASGGFVDLVRVIRAPRSRERDAHRALRPFRIERLRHKAMAELYEDQAAVLAHFENEEQAICDECARPWPVVRKLSSAANNAARARGAMPARGCSCGALVLPVELRHQRKRQTHHYSRA